ncbi:MAG: hypothetical protein ACRBB0_14280 [Pelagimonas sp.]|uniref:hypothetical protein n=1 Tax=Pelagimonas sp. TaxID=2073170 RepID=UPI003D6A1166
MAGTQVEALSRLEVQSGIQRDLFAKAEAHMEKHRKKALANAQAHMRMRGFPQAQSGFHIPEKTTPFLSPLTRFTVLVLLVVVLSPVASMFWGVIL